MTGIVLELILNLNSMMFVRQFNTFVLSFFYISHVHQALLLLLLSFIDVHFVSFSFPEVG